MYTGGVKGQIGVILTSIEAWMVLYDIFDDWNVINYASNSHGYFIATNPIRIGIMD